MGLAIIYFLISRFSIDFEATLGTIKRSNPTLYLLAVFVHYTTFLFRGQRWRLLLINAGVTRSQEISLPSVIGSGRLILIGWFASSVTWFRIGDAYRAYAYAKESGASFARSGGTVVAERLMDILLVSGLLLIGFLSILTDSDNGPPQILLVVGFGLAGVSLLALLGLHLFWKRAAMFFPRRLFRTYVGFRQGIIQSFRLLPQVGVFGLLGWLAEVGRLYLVIKATGLDVGIDFVLFVAIAGALLSATPITPGGLGVVEAGIAGILALTISEGAAVSIALLDRSISYLSVVIVGPVALAYHQHIVIKKTRSESRLAS
ncbi:MAG: hypothetical protein DK304_001111 [Chloroflexi bacterium]|nr:MAG: hypothetical protein DK304_001111 [Chloroflexota bacterium]